VSEQHYGRARANARVEVRTQAKQKPAQPTVGDGDEKRGRFVEVEEELKEWHLVIYPFTYGILFHTKHHFC
jgi:hypothetical protein